MLHFWTFKNRGSQEYLGMHVDEPVIHSGNMPVAYFNDLKQTQRLLWNSLRDPCITNKAQTFRQIQEIEHTLVTHGYAPYFCKLCQKPHRSGKKHLDHRSHAEIHLQFPALHYPNVETEIFTQVVGIYYTGMGKYVKKLPQKTELTLIPESNNPHDEYAIGVWHRNQRIGYIPRGVNIQIFQALADGCRVRCVFGRYRGVFLQVQEQQHFSNSTVTSYSVDPDALDGESDEDLDAGMTFVPERADITVFIQNSARMTQVVEGIAELIELGYTNIEPGFEKLGLETLHMLERRLEKRMTPEIVALLS